MKILMLVLSALVAYLLGSLNFGVIVSRLALNIDIRDHGSGNAGTTNAYRVMGPKLAKFVILGDALKGVLAYLAGSWLAGEYGALTAMFFVLVGHALPVFFKFRGGKCALTAAAVVGMFDWRIMLIIVSVFVITIVITKYVSLGSIMGAAVFPVMVFVWHANLPCILTALAMSFLVIFLHRKNIKRLIAGTESKFKVNKTNLTREDKEK